MLDHTIPVESKLHLLLPAVSSAIEQKEESEYLFFTKSERTFEK